MSATKILSVIITALTVIIGVVAAAILINVVVCRIRNKPVNFFGYSIAVVQTGSMQPTILKGDLIVYRPCKYSDLKESDIIVFIAGDGFSKDIQGQSVVHRVKEITENGIITKGDNNYQQDNDLVTEDNLLGLCTGNSHFWGVVFTAFSKYGIFIIIAIIAVPFIVGQIIKIVKLSKQKEDKVVSEYSEVNDLSNVEVENINSLHTEDNSKDEGTEL